MKPGPVATTAAVLLLTLIWGTTWAAIRIGLEAIPPLTGVSLRPGRRRAPGDRIDRRRAVVGFGGVAVIFSEDFAKLGGLQVAVAAVVMLLSPLAAAVSNVLIKSRGRDIHPISLAAVPMIMASALVGGTAAVFERDRPVVFSKTSVAALLYLALFGSAVTFGLYYWLLSHHRVTRLSLICCGVPVVGVFVGAVFLHEPVTARVLAGSALVVAGVALAVHRPGKRSS